MVLGNIDQDDMFCKAVAKDVNCTIVSVEYRLAPEHPYPAPLEDCYSALRWLAWNAVEIGADASRIAIGGASAGAGLAAGLALLARDRGEVAVAFQLLIYPMVDDRNITPSSQAITHPSVWNREANIAGWRAYPVARSAPTTFHHTPCQPGHRICPDCRRHTSLSESLICSSTRTSTTHNDCCRPVCPPSCTSIQVRSTARICSSPTLNCRSVGWRIAMTR